MAKDFSRARDDDGIRPEQILKKLREANAMLAAGKTGGEVLLRTAAQKLAERTVLFDKRAISTLASGV